MIMGEPGESKRDQAVEVLCEILARLPCPGITRPATFVGLVIDAAKEEIRAELAEQAEEDRWHVLKAMVDGSTTSHWLGGEFVEEWRALRAKREAAGKSTD
jgi:hypothetical protein